MGYKLVLAAVSKEELAQEAHAPGDDGARGPADAIDRPKHHGSASPLSSNAKAESRWPQEQRNYSTILAPASLIESKLSVIITRKFFILLQTKNGSAMGRVLHSNVTATEIIKNIALEMQHRLVCYIKQHKPKITVLTDERTSISNTSTLIIYLRGIFENESTPVTIYFGLQELA